MAQAMSETEGIVSTLLSENSKDNFLQASDVLLKFANNILNNPNEEKFRRIRIANPAVQSKLLNTVGGMECLFLMGFQETQDGEYLTMPKEASLSPLSAIRDRLLQECSKLKAAVSSSSQHQQGTSQRVQQLSARAASAAAPPIVQTQSEMAFSQRIRDGMRRVLQYENPRAQQKARLIIPLEDLRMEAETKFKAAQEKGETKLKFQDYLLLALLKWFKHSFFKWVDTLPCCQCGSGTKHNGSARPSEDDLRWGASRVEAHFCNKCNVTTRFPRYTNPEKLLDTHRGRCGEWADCFTLCCRALGFEARYVMDWTDHVWTEVYSVSRSRWVHCDPCENVCDKPLLYESGWGKKLTYVIAVSKDEVQDVSWRYSAKHEELLARRKLCRESWLRHTIHRMWLQQITTLPELRQKELWTRLLCELAEFICVKDNIENLPGRSTGSLEWRQARGEMGNLNSDGNEVGDSSSNSINFVFIPSETERESEVIHLVYNSATDKYVRKSAENRESIGWETCVFSYKQVIRKEELDWKMAYLARAESSNSAEITWKFDLTDTDLRIGKVEIKAQSAVFEGGNVSWRICAGDNCFIQTGDDLQDLKKFDMKGSKTLLLTAVLRGGKGNNAWQHSQLFRQSSLDKDNYPFEIKLMLS